MELAVVMQTQPEAYEEVLKRLRAEELNPVALADPDSGAHYFPGSHAYAKTRPIVYIAVPPDERIYAERFLKEWQEALHEESKQISAQARGNAVTASLVAGAVGLVTYVLKWDFSAVIMLSAATWFVAFVITLSRSSKQSDTEQNVWEDIEES